MSSRRCGYCRAGGHRADKCGVKDNQIEAVRRHMYHEKVALHRLMLQNGLGVGAIVETFDKEICVIRSLRDCFGGWMNQFVDWRNIKYSKSVRSNLHSYSGINHHRHLSVDNMLVRHDPYSHFFINPNPLRDLSLNNYSTVCLSVLPHPPVDNTYVQRDLNDHYYRERSVKILSPSDETDIDEMEFFTEPFKLHERLGKNESGYGITTTPVYAPIP